MVDTDYDGVMSGNPETGAVNIRLQILGTERDSAVWVQFTAEECKGLESFAESLVNKQPLSHVMGKRTFLINGTHRATIRGWWNGSQWHNYEEPQCETCSLSIATCEGIKLAARLCITRMDLQGCIIEMLC